MTGPLFMPTQLVCSLQFATTSFQQKSLVDTPRAPGKPETLRVTSLEASVEASAPKVELVTAFGSLLAKPLTMQCAQSCCGSNEPEEIGNIERQPDPLEDEEEINAAITGLTCARPRNLIKRSHIWRAVVLVLLSNSFRFMVFGCL